MLYYFTEILKPSAICRQYRHHGANAFGPDIIFMIEVKEYHYEKSDHTGKLQIRAESA